MDPLKGDKLCRMITEGMERFYSNPENMKAYEKWKKEREEKKKKTLQIL